MGGRHPRGVPWIVVALGVLAPVGPVRAGEDPVPYALRPAVDPGAGGTRRARLAIDVADGYRWNPEYPFRLVLSPGTGLPLDRAEFGREDVRVAGDERSATVDLGVVRGGPGDFRARGRVSFSLCTGKVCRVFRDREVEWKAAGGAP